MSNQKTIRLGITMAGAVSAGAYTAGVIDFLLETLEKWEVEKQKGNPKVPNYEAKIDVLGGTSAGGITAALMVLGLHQGVDPINKAGINSTKNNILFDTWVNFVDDEGKDNAFEKILQYNDINQKDGVPSLLNSSFIDIISEKALANFKKIGLPTYVSKDFEVLLSLSNLRGIPVEVGFNSDQEHREQTPTHTMRHHKMLAHFKANTLTSESEGFFGLNVDNIEDCKRLIHFAKATSAFPLGLKARKINGLSSKFIIENLKKFVHPDLIKKGLVTFPDLSKLPETYDFTAVDGGAMNNEPFGEIGRLLENRGQNQKEGFDDFAMMMIDPFPNFTENAKNTYEQPNSIFELAANTVSSLRAQSSFKASDLLTLKTNEFKRNLVYPVRYVNYKPVTGNVMACGALGGFSGLLGRKLREHDFFLGRDNCRNFLRYIFTNQYKMKEDGSIDRTNMHPIHKDWTVEMIQTFGITHKKNQSIYLPIIPDVEKLHLDKKEEGKVFKKHYISNFPNILPQQILNYADLINARIEKIVNHFLLTEKSLPTEDVAQSLKATIGLYIKRKGYFKSGGLKNWVAQQLQPRIQSGVTSLVTKKLVETILYDLTVNGLINREDFRNLK